MCGADATVRRPKDAREIREPHGQCCKLTLLYSAKRAGRLTIPQCAENGQRRTGVTPRSLVRRGQDRSNETGRRICAVRANVALR